MRALAEYAMRGRREAMLLAVGASVLPLVYWVGAALVGLVTLRRGARDGLVVTLAVAVPATVYALLGEIRPLAIAVGTLLVACVLRWTVSWPWALCAVAMMGLALSSGLHFGPSELLAEMQRAVGSVFEAAARQAPDAATAALFAAPTRTQTAGMFGLMCSGTIAISLVLARWWQAQLYNPGGLRAEMHALRLSGVQVLGLLAIAVALYRLGPDFQPWAWIPLVPMVVAGIGLVHALLAGRAGAGWLGLMYAGLLLLPPVKHVLVVLAAMDGWLDLRQRLLRPRDGNDDKV